MSEPNVSRKEFSPGRMQQSMFVVGVVLLLFVLWQIFGGDEVTKRNALQSYLWAWVFWGGLTFGCFAMTLLHHSLKGAWGTSVMRIWEAGGGPAALTTFGVLFFPLIYAMHSGTAIIYAWADPAIRTTDQVLIARQPLMNPLMVTLVTVGIFVLWVGYSLMLRNSTLRQDESLDSKEEKKRFTRGPVGLVMYFLSATVAFTIWVMSVDTHWSSTMYAPWFVVGQAFAALCFGVFLVCRFSDRAPYSEIMSPKLTLDLGNMMLALTLFFSYLSFSQYLIIWSGNIPEYTSYYHTRAQGGWIWIGLSMVALQFFIPFLMLINPTTKRYPNKLMVVAAWIFIVRIIDSFWIVLPAFPNRETPMPLATDATAFIALGAIWLAVFANQTKKASLLPVYDQRLKEALHHSHA
jgi:hypothetical protein